MRMLNLTNQEFADLAGLLNEGVKHIGLGAAIPAARLLAKMEAAQLAAQGCWTAIRDNSPDGPLPEASVILKTGA
jgi:hypothetical protein